MDRLHHDVVGRGGQGHHNGHQPLPRLHGSRHQPGHLRLALDSQMVPHGSWCLMILNHHLSSPNAASICENLRPRLDWMEPAAVGISGVWDNRKPSSRMWFRNPSCAEDEECDDRRLQQHLGQSQTNGHTLAAAFVAWQIAPTDPPRAQCMICAPWSARKNIWKISWLKSSRSFWKNVSL